MIIQKNIPALRTLKEQNQTIKATSKNLERLSSGFRINRAADDAAGLAISEKMRAKITELSRCQINAQEGLDIARSADGALAEVNTMLRRAHSLCIKASNGTYSESERSKLSDEMNEIFDEIDRITAGTTFNDIRLFRGDVEEEYYWEIVEDFNKLPPGQLATWGEMKFIKSEDFHPAPDAEPAKASFELDDSIELNNVSTLEGKSISIGGNTFTFTKNPSSSSSLIINLNTYNTVEKALKSLENNYYSNINKVEIDKKTKTVTLTAKCIDKQYDITLNGVTSKDSAPKGKAEYMNGVSVQNPGGNSISQVDGAGATNNQPKPISNITGDIKLLPNMKDTDTLGSANINLEDLKKNEIQITANGSPTKISLNQLSPVPSASTTKAQLGNAIATLINNKLKISNIDYTVTYNNGVLSINVEKKNATSDPNTRLPYDAGASISEIKIDSIGAKKEYDPPKWSSNPLNITVKRTQEKDKEKGEQAEITIPSNLNVPFSFTVGGNAYLYYDSSSSNNLQKPAGSAGIDTSPSCSCIDVKGKSPDEIKKMVFDSVESYAKTFGAISTTINGNTITATTAFNKSFNSYLYSSSGIQVDVKPYKYVGGTPGTNKVLGLSGSFYRNVEISFELGKEADIANLVGRGFGINGAKFEFTNGSIGKHESYNDIDISGCTNFVSLQQKVQAVMGNTYKVSINADGKMAITMKKLASSTISVTDGSEGVIKTSPVTFSGGKDVGYSYTEIDFSSINSDNINTLLGKGFRINCATCAGEYINIFFCWENDGSIPPNFERFDDSTGQMRTIHNIPVELSKITSGDKIVEDIIRQVKPSLNHFTDIDKDINNPTKLIARDKRLGHVADIVDPNKKPNESPNKLYLGKVQTGVETNFTYDAEENEELILPGGKNEVTLLNSEVKIYVGSDPSPQYIPIHLPYLDLTYLKLDPPEWVDFNDPEQDAGDWLTRVDQANIAIASARGIIGADYNRLEYAFNDLCNYEENLTYAESLIRDADFAHEKMKQIKNQILSQSQQAMLSQASAMPQQVLQLLQ